MSHLNKVCPENVPVIVERIAETELLSAEDLDVVVSLVFDRALAEQGVISQMGGFSEQAEQVLE